MGGEWLETCMDSCMPSTGAQEDHFECLGKALAWSSRHNSITTVQASFPHVLTIYHKAGIQERLPKRANLLVFKNDCERVFVDIFDVTLKEKAERQNFIPMNAHKTATRGGAVSIFDFACKQHRQLTCKTR